MNFTLIAFDGEQIIGTHKVEKSIKTEIETFKQKIKEEYKVSISCGINLRDDNKNKLVSFSIEQDADGDRFVRIWDEEERAEKEKQKRARAIEIIEQHGCNRCPLLNEIN